MQMNGYGSNGVYSAGVRPVVKFAPHGIDNASNLSNLDPSLCVLLYAMTYVVILNYLRGKIHKFRLISVAFADFRSKS